jgi:pyrimidine-nucleoside phosphorylase
MVPQWIIEKKRDGHALSPEEIRDFISAFTDGSIPDYQMSALAMAIYFKGMNSDEIAALTKAMMESGDVLELSSIKRPTSDKHSTGGIGDKVSLILAPLAAACGLAVPMISGRGLGITGGTLDKMESIPGYRTDLQPEEFEAVIAECGCSIIGQTANLAPADKKLYALRDVTGTVPSIPLISASIMSKKLAEGADSLVLDVKWGSGAFMKTVDQARDLAKTMIGIGASMKRRVSALITNMNQPLGHTAGNALEVIESLETLMNRGPKDLTELTLELCAEMLVLSGMAKDRLTALAEARRKLESGAALSVFKSMVELHGGNADVVGNIALLPSARLKHEVRSRQAGHLAEMDANGIGRAALILGAGRRSVLDRVDHSAGISNIAKVGSKISKGDLLMVLHAGNQDLIDESLPIAAGSCSVSEQPPEVFELITDRITGGPF